MNKKKKIVVSVSGASGAIYAKVLFDRLQQLHNQVEEVGILMSDNAKYVWKTELVIPIIKIYLLNFISHKTLPHHLRLVRLALKQ